MTLLKRCFSAIAIIVIVFSSNTIASDAEKAITARQAHMQTYAFNLGVLGNMAKGKTPYHADKAKTAAQNLLMLSSMNNASMWPQGSSQSDEGLGDKTRALAEIWTNFPKVMERHQVLTTELQHFVTIAGKDLASLKGGLGKVGAGCKGCHQDFRAAK